MLFSDFRWKSCKDDASLARIYVYVYEEVLYLVAFVHILFIIVLIVCALRLFTTSAETRGWVRRGRRFFLGRRSWCCAIYSGLDVRRVFSMSIQILTRWQPSSPASRAKRVQAEREREKESLNKSPRWSLALIWFLGPFFSWFHYTLLVFKISLPTQGQPASQPTGAHREKGVTEASSRTQILTLGPDRP